MSQQPSGGPTEVAAVAADPATGRITLWTLGVRCLGSRSLARALAANTRLPRPLLWWLALRRWDVRSAVAANPRCPRLLLRMMTLSGDWALSAAVAGNPVASRRLLNLLARTSEPCVRLHLAANPSLTSQLADRLLADSDPYVRGVAAAHPAASAAALSRLAHGMKEPAWILRRIAVNPSCPAGLSDQLLTWITLGGPGNADPAFDPVECTGHPGDTSVPAVIWYRDQAKRANAEQHPLWRVRAAVLSASGRVHANRAWVLARDPRPEVRRTIAGAARLSLDIRVELRRDGDPIVASLARTRAPQAKHGARSWRPLVLIVTLLGGPVLIGVQVHLDDQGQSAPSVTTGGVSPRVVPITSARLPGGGNLTCGPLPEDRFVTFVQISAGSRRLMMHVASGIAKDSGQILQPPDATVAPGHSAQFQLLSGPSPLTVTASAEGRFPRAVVSVGRCG